MSVSGAPKARRRRAASKAIAFYDLDGTLVDLNLVHATLFVLTNLGEWSGRLKYLIGFAGRLPMLYAAERRDRYLLNVVLFEALKGISRDRLYSLGEEYCQRVLLKHIYPQAHALVEANRTIGLEPVLVTGSPDFIVAPLAEQLKVQQFAANRLAYSGGLATGQLRAPVLAGEEKAQWCRAHAVERGLALSSCWGYADSYYDLPFLAALGHPVAVNPDRRLAATARQRHWPTLHFTAEAARSGPRFEPARVASRTGGHLNGAARS
jgi:alcohol-forming fatty acyl-CoA reductase